MQFYSQKAKYIFEHKFKSYLFIGSFTTISSAFLFSKRNTENCSLRKSQFSKGFNKKIDKRMVLF